METTSCHDPLASSLDELVKHESDVTERETADVEREELGSIADAQLQAHLCL